MRSSRGVRVLLAMWMSASLSACSLSAPDGTLSRVTVRVAQQAEPARALQALWSGAVTPPTSVGGFDCLAVNVMGLGIPPVPHSCNCTAGSTSCTCGQDDLQAYNNLPANIAGSTFCAYPGVTSSPFAVPASGAAHSVQLSVPSGPERIVEMVGIMDANGTVCGSPIPVGNSGDGGNAHYFELGRAVLDLFSSQAVSIPDTFDALSAADQAKRQLDCGQSGKMLGYIETVTAEPTLLAYWPLDESLPTTENARGSGAALFGGMAESTAISGIAGPLIDSLDPSPTYAFTVSIPTETASGVTVSSFTVGPVSVEAWVKVSTGSMCSASSPSRIFLVGTGGLPSLELNCTNTNKAEFRVTDVNGNMTFVDSTASIWDAQWHHVVGVWNQAPSSKPRIYVDGLDSTSSTGTAATVQSIDFGVDTNFSVSGSIGPMPAGTSIAHVAIYGSPLSSTQVQTHFHASGR